jgi:adenylate cyclase
MGRRFLWQPDIGVSVTEAEFARVDEEDYQTSPVVYLYGTGRALRRRLANADCPNDFPILDVLRGVGITDYLVSPPLFLNGEIHVATWATRLPGGFTDAQIAGIEAVVAPLARVAEIHALRRTASNLLDAYVGHHAGERILGPRIRRGDTEAIHAVIWLSDMRGFTALADRLPPQTLIDLLNGYFDCQVPAILARGGEVLKFVGDGLLAIFPVAGGRDATRRVCNDVLRAAREARTKVAAMQGSAGLPPGGGVRFGLALHLGDVLYGNIGGGNRLDFTCIGPAVNLAARIEKLTGEVGRVILASSQFARNCPHELMPVGEFALRGFGAAHAIFGLVDESGE